MVTNFYFKCDVCNSIINLKWQVGFVERAPISIVCPKCKTLLKFTLITNQNDISINIDSKNTTLVKEQIPDFFAETSSELLTYKITRQKEIIPGNTPFLRTFSFMKKNYVSFKENISRGLYAQKNISNIYHRINDLYYNKNIDYLTKELSKYNDIKNEEKKLSKLEVIEQLYYFNINYYLNFFSKTDIDTFSNKNMSFMKILRNEKRNKYDDFLNNYCSYEVFREYDNKIYKSINLLLDNFYLFIPAISLNYIEKNKHKNIINDYTLTTTNFEDIKNIYISIYENMLNVYDIIILLNNILERNNYISFSQNVKINNKFISTINQFKNLSKGNKLKFIKKNQFYNNLMPVFNKNIRNSIGHESWDYVPFEHKIIFKNEKGTTTNEMHLLEFVYECWNLGINCISIYKVIQDVKRHHELNHRPDN